MVSEDCSGSPEDPTLFYMRFHLTMSFSLSIRWRIHNQSNNFVNTNKLVQNVLGFVSLPLNMWQNITVCTNFSHLALRKVLQIVISTEVLQRKKSFQLTILSGCSLACSFHSAHSCSLFSGILHPPEIHPKDPTTIHNFPLLFFRCDLVISLFLVNHYFHNDVRCICVSTWKMFYVISLQAKNFLLHHKGKHIQVPVRAGVQAVHKS